MTIPNVYMGWCQRKAICKWCSESIEAGTPMVTVFYWNKGNKDKRGWNVKYHYHPQHWLDQGLDYLKMNPYVAYTRHKKSTLTVKQQTRRLAILRKKAALDQRKRNLKSDYPERLLVEARIDRQIAQLMVDIVPVGGIPRKWLEHLT